MVCKYCGKESGTRDICSECSKEMGSFTEKESQCDTSSNQTNRYGSQDSNSYVPKPKFFSFPRILALIGVLLYVVCLIMPVYNVTLLDYAQPDKQALLDISCYFAAIPVVMLYNIVFDKSRWMGLHFRILRFKLLILFSIINIATLTMAPAMFIDMGYNISVNSFTGYFYLAIFACILSLAAPFFVKEENNTGITPVKKIDLLWIMPAFAFLAILIFRLYYLNSIGEYFGKLPNDYYDTAYDDYSADSYNDEYDAYEQEPENTQTSPSDAERDRYIEKLENTVDMVYLDHCVYDVDKDGIDDIIFRSPADDETLFYFDSDATGTINIYDVYIYKKEEGDFVYSGQVATMNEKLYGSDYNGLYGCFDNLMKALFMEDEEMDFPITTNIVSIYIDYLFDGTEITIDDQNSLFELADLNEHTYGAGDEDVSASSYYSAESEIQANLMVFEDREDNGQIYNASYNP